MLFSKPLPESMRVTQDGYMIIVDSWMTRLINHRYLLVYVLPEGDVITSSSCRAYRYPHFFKKDMNILEKIALDQYREDMRPKKSIWQRWILSHRKVPVTQ